MKKAAIVVMGIFFCIAAPSFAQSYADSKAQDLSADANAEAKDNTAIAKDKSTIAQNRAAKARAKANGDLGAQAVDSVKLGANHAATTEKQSEKDMDKQITTHDAQNE